MSTHNICFCGVIRKLFIWSPSVLELNSKCPKISTPKCLTKWHNQTVQIQIRLLLKEQSDQGLHSLPSLSTENSDQTTEMHRLIRVLTLVLLCLDVPCLCKECISRSVGFFRLVIQYVNLYQQPCSSNLIG